MEMVLDGRSMGIGAATQRELDEKPAAEATAFPVPVAEDYADTVMAANGVVDIVKRHLGFERKLQGRSNMSPNGLCPEQKKSVASDLKEVL